MNFSRLVSSPWWRAPLLLARRPGVALALGLAGVVAVLPAATAPLFVSAAQTATLHRQITSDCAGRSGATIADKALGGSAGFTVERAVAERATAGVPNLGADQVTVSEKPFTFTSATGSQTSVFVARQGFLHHVDVVTRAPVPTGVPAVWVPDDAASRWGVVAGDRLTVDSPDGSVPVAVAGTYHDLRFVPTDAFWCPIRPLYKPLDPFADALPMVLADPATLLSVAEAVQAPAADELFEFPLANNAPDRGSAGRTVAALPTLAPAMRAGLPDDGFQLGSVTSELPRFVQRSDLVASSLRLPIYAASAAAVLVGLFVVGAATLLWTRRREHELVVLATRGSAPLGMGGKAVLESAPALLVGALIGWLSARGLTGAVGPGGAVDPRVSQVSLTAAAAIAVAALLTVLVVATYRCRSFADAPERSRSGWWSLVPWEVVLLAAAWPVWRWLGGATRVAGTPVSFTGSVVELPGRVFLVPIVVIVAGAVLVARCAAVVARLHGLAYAPAGHARFLAWRRIIRDPLVMAALLTATVVTAALAGYGAAVTSSAQATVAAKAHAVTGADVVVDIDAPAGSTVSVPATLAQTGTATVVRRSDSIGVAGLTVSLLAVDPAAFPRVAPVGDLLAGRPLADLLAAARPGQPPTVVASAPVPAGIQQFQTATGQAWTARVVAVPDLPGRKGGEPVVLAPRGTVPAALLGDAHAAIWVHTTNPQRAAAVATTLAGVRNITVADDIFVGTLYEPVTYAFGYFVAVAALTALVVVVGLLLHLEARTVSHRRAYIVLRRMGLRARSHRAALLWEIGSILGTGVIVAVAGVVLLARGLRAALDVDPSIPPGTVLSLPVVTFAVAVAVAALVAIVAAGYAHARVARANPAEVLRDAD